MNNVLVLKSSILADSSQTNQLSDYLESKLTGKNIAVRDLAVNQLPHAVNRRQRKKTHYWRYLMN